MGEPADWLNAEWETKRKSRHDPLLRVPSREVDFAPQEETLVSDTTPL